MTAQWIAQGVLSIFLIYFMLQIGLLYTSLYISICVYVIIVYGLGIHLSEPYDSFRIWATTSAAVIIIQYLSNLFSKVCTHSDEHVS